MILDGNVDLRLVSLRVVLLLDDNHRAETVKNYEARSSHIVRKALSYSALETNTILARYVAAARSSLKQNHAIKFLFKVNNDSNEKMNKCSQYMTEIAASPTGVTDDPSFLQILSCIQLHSGLSCRVPTGSCIHRS